MGFCNKYNIYCKLANVFGYCQMTVCNKYFQNGGNNFSYNGGSISTFLQSACVNCPNNPNNGGSGICNCILGQIPWK